LPIFYLTDGLSSIETIVLAKNNQGLKDLFKLSSAIKMKEKTETPIEWLNKYIDHLFIIFKNVTEAHQSILQNFTDKEDIFVNHNSQQRLDFPVVWAQSTNYLNEDDADTLTALAAIKNNEKLDLVKE